MNKEIRTFDFEIRAENDEKRGDYIEGRAIVYDDATNMGWYEETISNGALDETDLKDVRLLVNHNTDMIPLARSRNNTVNSTMQLITDENGLSIRANLDTENNADAKSLYSAVKRGDISGMSFMFSVRDEEWQDIDTEHPTRRIKDIGTVVEVSAVTFPAYQSTEIYARSKEAVETALNTLESVRQQRAQSLESDTKCDELELAKAKYEFKSKS